MGKLKLSNASNYKSINQYKLITTLAGIFDMDDVDNIILCNYNIIQKVLF